MGAFLVKFFQEVNSKKKQGALWLKKEKLDTGNQCAKMCSMEKTQRVQEIKCPRKHYWCLVCESEFCEKSPSRYVKHEDHKLILLAKEVTREEGN